MRALLITFLVLSNAVSAKEWYPVDIKLWTPAFNELLIRRDDTYIPLKHAARKWRICVSIPNLKDAAWKAISFGIISEVRRQGVAVQILDAGGYGNLDKQIAQINECIADNADGLIVSSVSFEGLDPTINNLVASGFPVIDLINGTKTHNLSARSAGSFWDNGFLTGQYLSALSKELDNPLKVAWLPGPQGPGWAKQLQEGFYQAISGANIEVVFQRNGDLDNRVQLGFINELLDKNINVDLIVTSEAVINSAVKTLRQRGVNDKIKLMTFYYGPDAHNHIKRGNVIAATSESMVAQARMSIDTIIRILENKPFYKHHGAEVFVVNKNNIDQIDPSLSLAPKGYRTIFSHDW